MLWGLMGVAPAFAGEVKDIDRPLRTGAASPHDSAVIIGVERYPFLQLDVPYATRDAEAFETLSIYTLGIPPSRVQFLEGPTLAQMVNALQQAGEETTSKGTVYVYFAGHGASSSDGDRMLLGADVPYDVALFDSAGLTLDRIQKLAGRSSASVVVLADACYAGVGRTGDAIVEGARHVVPAYALEARSKSVIWTAAGPAEVAGPLDAVEHGAFSYFAIGALRGWADGEVSGEPDGEVTTEEASLFISRALKEVGIRSQHPSLVGDTQVLSKGSKLEAAPDLLALREAHAVAGKRRSTAAEQPHVPTAGSAHATTATPRAIKDLQLSGAIEYVAYDTYFVDGEELDWGKVAPMIKANGYSRPYLAQSNGAMVAGITITTLGACAFLGYLIAGFINSDNFFTALPVGIPGGSAIGGGCVLLGTERHRRMRAVDAYNRHPDASFSLAPHKVQVSIGPGTIALVF